MVVSLREKMIAQVSFLCFISLAVSSPLYQAPINGNPSVLTIYDIKPQPYSFNVNVKDEYGTIINRQEQGDELGNKKGSYGYTDAYGISRQVDYIADDKGFRAIVRTNEPGTENQNPADVEIQSNAVQYQEPSSNSKARSPYSISSISAHSRPAPSSAYRPQVSPVYGTAAIKSIPARQVYATPVSRVSLNPHSSTRSQPARNLY